MKLKPNERIDQIYSQNVKIIQNPKMFAFSLDAVALSSFAKIPKNKKTRVVDLCAGNGVIGLLTQHQTNGMIIEIEIQPQLADMAKRSIEMNQLDSKIKVLNIDLKNTYQYIPKDSVDVVTCNPPYFKNLVTSKKNPNPYLAIARHEIKTNLESTVKIASGLLKMNGKAFFVYRPDRLSDILIIMRRHRMEPKQIRFVYPKEQKNANIVLIKAIKDGHADGLKILPPLFAYQGNHYSKEVRKMLYGK
ncbi:methyltransferase [Philodulcilactobacillus myokoensis]|uniref:Methyltransferase n=1 Tax=Philodulcilactobacillus myokoensis TaxID=2929573 RepID=A0A9W6ETE7_9LACO|nr:tRNA1(Val) (adenine(37)-N6)-methyltransferase [Philodulcilactobacillus myokoensis]GLB46959.1 methyltransferase [Philodulcilactobacillus myokoensis]